MRRVTSLLLVSLALPACKGEIVEQGVLVTVDNKSGATAIVQLLVRAINQDSSEVFPLPEMPQSTPLSFPTQFSISLPSTRNGRVDIVIDGLNPLAIPVASGTGFAVLQGSTFVGATVDLLPVAIPPATGGTGGPAGTGGAVGSGGITGGGGELTGLGGTVGAGGVVGTGGAGGDGGVVGTGGTVGMGGTVETGGVVRSGGIPGTGGVVGTGGIVGTGGAASATGGSTGPGTDGGTTPVGQSAGCGKTSTITSSQYNNGNPISITVNGSQRRYILAMPTNYSNTTPYKFILGIHALNSNDKSVYSEKYYGLQPLSNNTVIFAAPNGVNGSNPCSGTGVGDSGCGWPSGNNNMQLMDAVVKQVTDNFCVDMNHIYATGWSYGASMSYEVGCERPLGGPTSTATWGVRAIAIYAAAQMSGSCKPSIPIGYYASHGTNDTVLSYDGGVNLAKNFATANGCTWATPPKASDSHICTNLTGCKTGYPVEFCSFVGGHTAYPDSDNKSNSWGPAEVWKFLSQF